jgi:hypothetical protein
VAALSGIGGSHLRVFDSTDGDLILEKKLHSHRTDRLSEPRQSGVSVAFATDGSLNMFVLTNGHTLYHMNAAGGIKWAWTSPDSAYASIMLCNFGSNLFMSVPWLSMNASSSRIPPFT